MKVNIATDREKIINALELVLLDKAFLVAPKSSAFLRYVVLQTLDGNADRIKAYTIAIDALGRPSSFDPQSDPSIRVMAKRLRDMLRDYYSRTTGHDVVVQFKVGCYAPQFIIKNENKRSDEKLKTNSLQTNKKPAQGH